MPKTRGAGSITQLEKGKPRARCRKWQLRVFVGRDEKGKPHYKTRRFEGAYRQAVEELKAFAADVERGKAPNVDGRMTVRAYYARFTEARSASGNFKPRTIRANDTTMRNFLDALGDKRMVDVKTSDVERLYAKLRSEGGRSGKPMMQSSILQLHHCIVCLFNHAKERGDVPPDALRGLKAPKAGKSRRRAMEDEEAAELASKLMVHDAKHVAALLCLECGLRRSEAVALEWGCVHDRCVEVVKAAEEDDGSKVGSPKSDSGTRKVPVPEKSWRFLMIWRERQSELCGECDYVCSDGRDPITPCALSMWWSRSRESFGTDFTLHELRHTYATRLIRAGANPKVVQRLLGHKKIDVTMDVYTHVNDSDLYSAVGLLD